MNSPEERNRSKFEAIEPDFTKKRKEAFDFEATEPKDKGQVRPVHADLTVNLSFDDAEFRFVSGGRRAKKIAQRGCVNSEAVEPQF